MRGWGIVLGIVLGLLVGLVLERARRRRRDAEALSRSFAKHGGRRVVFGTYDKEMQEAARRRRAAAEKK